MLVCNDIARETAAAVTVSSHLLAIKISNCCCTASLSAHHSASQHIAIPARIGTAVMRCCELVSVLLCVTTSAATQLNNTTEHATLCLAGQLRVAALLAVLSLSTHYKNSVHTTDYR
eukprot:6173-Heterococcus_DN1.PRE.2